MRTINIIVDHFDVQHLNILYTDFKIGLEDILTMEIPQWVIYPYGYINESDVVLQNKLIGISTNEELKAQFRNGYQAVLSLKRYTCY